MENNDFRAILKQVTAPSVEYRKERLKNDVEALEAYVDTLRFDAPQPELQNLEAEEFFDFAGAEMVALKARLLTKLKNI